MDDIGRNTRGYGYMRLQNRDRRTRLRRRRFGPAATPPVRPRFVPALVTIPFEDGLLIDGTDRLHVLQGKASKVLVPELIKLMDGSRTLQDLQEALPRVPEEDVASAVSLLFGCGVVEEGAPNGPVNYCEHMRTIDFLERHTGTRRIHCNGRVAYERLQSAHVTLIAPQDSANADAEALAELLRDTGVGIAVVEDRKAFRTRTPGATKDVSLVVSLSLKQEDRAFHLELDDWCAKNDVAWLRVSVGMNCEFIDVGPLFTAFEVPCYQCFSKIHLRAQAEKIVSGSRELSAAEKQFWIGMAAAEVAYVLTDIAPPISVPEFHRYDLRSSKVLGMRWPRIPGCDRCRPIPTCNRDRLHAPSPLGRDEIETAVIFEDYVGLHSRTAAFQTFQSALEQTRAARSLVDEVKDLPDSPHLNLKREIPKLDIGILQVLQDDHGCKESTLDVEALSSLLMMTGGIRRVRHAKGQVKRWAATAGNLGSVELFVICRNVKGLEQGVYFYHPRDHTLALFQREDDPTHSDDLLDRVLSSNSSQPDALVIFTGAYHRVSKKYGPLAYRLVNLDAGTAVSQLQLLASAQGIECQIETRWADDAIEKLLNLDSFREHVTAVVGLSSERKKIEMADQKCRAFALAPHLRPAIDAEQFSGLTINNIVEMLYYESRVSEQSVNSPFGIVPPDLLDIHEAEHVEVQLPPAASGGRFVGEVLAQRSSMREFLDDPVSLTQVSSMLACAHHADATDWPEEHRAGLGLTYLVLVSRVEGVAPGLYRYDPWRHGLRRSPGTFNVGNQVELFVQPELADAPLVIWIAGNLAGACARHGAFGHRQLLLRAGAAGNRLWMAGLGMGMAGCLVAGLIPGAAREILGLDGYKQASLLAVVCGHATFQFRQLQHRDQGGLVRLANDLSHDGDDEDGDPMSRDT